LWPRIGIILVGSPTTAWRGRNAPSSTRRRAPRQPTSSSAVKTSWRGVPCVREAAVLAAARNALVSAAPRPETFPSSTAGSSAPAQATSNGTQSVCPTSASPPFSPPRWAIRFAFCTPEASVQICRRVASPSARTCRSRTSSKGKLLRAEVESTAISSRSSETGSIIPIASASPRENPAARRRSRAGAARRSPRSLGWRSAPWRKPHWP